MPYQFEFDSTNRILRCRFEGCVGDDLIMAYDKEVRTCVDGLAPSPHVFGMSRMFQILGGDKQPTLYVVSSLDEVYAAIGVKQLHFEPLQPR